MKLIDKDALVAEIERRKQVAFGWMETAPNDAIEAEFELCDDILSFLDTLEVKEMDLDFEQELYKAFGQVKDFTLGLQIAKRFYDMGRNSKDSLEPVSEDLETFAEEWRDNNCPNAPSVIDAIKAGALWQRETLWKSADCDDLPIINREVIALLDNGKVVFAHRPPEYWDGKNIITGKVTRNYPKTYDKGGWNIPNVKWWLDCLMPKEIEL